MAQTAVGDARVRQPSSQATGELAEDGDQPRPAGLAADARSARARLSEGAAYRHPVLPGPAGGFAAGHCTSAGPGG